MWSFALVVGLLTLTPGLDTALILRTALLGHRTRAWGTVLGIQTGTLLWGTLTSAGLTALLTASRLAYDILRWAGAAYLLWMAARMILATSRTKRGDEEAGPETAPAGKDSLAAGWRQGLLTNLLNPKMGVFYVAILPQFIPEEMPHLAMGVTLTCVHITLGLVWSATLVGCAGVLGAHLRRPRARALLDRATGGLIAALAVRLAMSD
ncbi:LysE family translocator [Streptomyces sp. CA-253872]|uniref:LysE family translocator n=1 Tax=Streptomyces sp. CA-253872 TaxID=3240067 RepID=UPI003D932D82